MYLRLVFVEHVLSCSVTRFAPHFEQRFTVLLWYLTVAEPPVNASYETTLN